jgi:hypothetical protein
MKRKQLIKELKDWIQGGITYFERFDTNEAKMKKFAYKNILQKINELEKVYGN